MGFHKLKYYLAVIIMVTFGVNLKAQLNDDKPSFKDRITFGGNLGLGFGTVTNILINPQVGYRVTDNLMFGVGATYLYFRSTHPMFGTFETNITGFSIHARRRVMENFFAHVEYENLWLDAQDFNTGEVGRARVPIFLVGGGYISPLGGNTSVLISVLWDVIDDRRSPYINPIFRGGIIMGF
jgi:hypothetical protein